MIGQTLSVDGGRRAAWAVGRAVAFGILGWIGIRTMNRPAPESASEATVRIELLEPRGVLDSSPSRFAWPPVANAARYDVRIADDDAVWPLFVRRAASAILLLDPNEAKALSPGRIHVWEVEAKDAAGNTSR